MIAAESVTRRFGGRIAVENLSLTVAAGEVFALLGPNGAGKTTTLRMLAALIRPSHGTIRIDGAELNRRNADAMRGRIGLLTEAPGLWERLTVEANLLVHAGLHRLTAAPEAVRRELHRFDLWDRRHDLAGVLSKGMKQKLALARTLLHDPPVLLLDEPTAGLDPHTARVVRRLILALREEGRTVVVSTHNLDEAERIADRIGVLQRRLVACGAPDVLRRELFGTRLRIELLGSAARFVEPARQAGAGDVCAEGSVLTMALDRPEVQVPALVRALVGAGAAVRSVQEERAPLEEVYLRLMERP